MRRHPVAPPPSERALLKLKKGGQKGGLFGLRRRGADRDGGGGAGAPVHRIHIETPEGVCEEDKEGI